MNNQGKTKRHQITIGNKYWWVKIDPGSGHYFVSPQQEKEMAKQFFMTDSGVKDINLGIYVSLMEFMSAQRYDYHKRKN